MKTARLCLLLAAACAAQGLLAATFNVYRGSVYVAGPFSDLRQAWFYALQQPETGGYTIRCSGNWDFPAPEDDYDAARPWATYRTLAVSAADSPITLEVPASTTLTYDADKVDGSNSSPAFITSYSGTLTVTGGGTLHAEGDNAYTILTDGYNDVDAGHWVYDSNLTLQGVTIEILGGKNESAALPAIAAVHGTGTIVADGVTFRVVDEGCDLDTIGPGPIYQDSWPDAACSSRARAYRGSATGTFTDCVFVGGRSGGSVVYNFGSATFKDCTVSTPTEPLWLSSQYAEASGALRLSSRGTVMLDNLKLSVDESWSTAIHLSGDVAVTMTECDIPAGTPQVYLMDDATLTLTGGSTVACEIYVYGSGQDSSTVIVEDATVSGRLTCGNRLIVTGGTVAGLLDAFNDADVRLSGGTFTGKVQSTTCDILIEGAPTFSGSEVFLYGGEVSITGGTFNAPLRIELQNDDKPYIITGGTFNDTVKVTDTISVDPDAPTALEIRGGTFNESVSTTTANADGRLILRGGTFKERPEDSDGDVIYPADGSTGTWENGLYVVVRTWYDEDKTAFTIDDLLDLADFAQAVNETGATFAGKTVTLTADLDLADFGPWAPIGDGPRGENTQIGVFCGTFDGGGHTIRNLVCERNLDNHGAGFFGLVRGATIQDLTLAGNSALSNSLDAAGIVAIVDAGGKTTLSGLVNQTAAVSGACPGGIVGRVYGDETLIADCRNEGSIAIAADGKGGGIAGIIRHATTLTGCANAGAVSGGNSGTGGIAGYLSDGDFAFERCANTGAVSNDAAGQAFLGGVVGYVSSAASTLTLTDCTNGGELSAPNATAGAAGGIVGQLDVAQSATLTGCANTATVACPALPAVGGVAGACVHGDLIRCTNAAAVTGGNYAGGVAGRFGTGRLDRCVGGVGDVAAAKAAGRLVGLVSNGPKGMATFAIDDANGDAHSAALGSIGRVVDDTAGPAWGLATVEAGRLIGTPSLGNNTAAIRFAGPGKWAQKPDFLDYFAYPVLEGEAGHWQQEPGELTESERRVAQVETCFTVWTRQRQDDGAYAWGRAGAFIPASETRNATFGDAAALLRGLQPGETLFLAAPATLTNLDIPEGAFLDLNHHALTLVGQPTAGSLERLIPHADPTTAIDRSDLDGERSVWLWDEAAQAWSTRAAVRLPLENLPYYLTTIWDTLTFSEGTNVLRGQTSFEVVGPLSERDESLYCITTQGESHEIGNPGDALRLMGLSVSDYLGQVEGQYAYDENGAPIYILDDEGNYIDNRGNPTETPVPMPRRAWKMGYDFGVGGLRLSGAGEAVATVRLNLKRARRIVQDGGNLVMPPTTALCVLVNGESAATERNLTFTYVKTEGGWGYYVCDVAFPLPESGDLRVEVRLQDASDEAP